jgi:hypothetical protein
MLGEAGRQIQVRSSQSKSGGPVLYLCDVRTGHLHVLQLCPDAYRHPEIEKAMRTVDFAEICGGLCTVMEVMSGKRALNEKLESLLVSMSALYVVGTATYKATKDANFSQHIIISYPPVRAEPRRVLRLIPVVHHLPLNHCELEAIVEHVLQADRQRRPALFPSGPVPRFVVSDVAPPDASASTGSEWLPDGPGRPH